MHVPTPYLTFAAWCADRYGAPLHRVPLDLGFGCPNRAADGTGGCAFCAEDGGRARQLADAGTVKEQVAAGLQFATRRYRARAFMAYVQAFTGTFAPESEQRALIERILDQYPFQAISIGTRPDCLPDPVLAYLCDLRKRVDVWVELGVQTSHDATLARLNRGHDWACSQNAVLRLHDCGLRTAVHLITGLPGETLEDGITTATRLAELPFDGIKLHNLHVLRGTALAEEYARAPLPVLDEYEHTEWVLAMLRHIPGDVAVMRLQTDSPPEALIAPHWSMSKGRFLEFVAEQMRLREIRQGDATTRPLEGETPVESPTIAVAVPVPTGDGSITLFNPEVKEHYHAPPGAVSEAVLKYVRPCGLRKRLERGHVRLLDIGFGLGTNTLAASEVAAELAAESTGGGRCPESYALEVDALEIDRRAVRRAAETVQTPADARLDWPGILSRLLQDCEAREDSFHVSIFWGDARFTLRERLRTGCAYDLVFLDPFSTQRNSQLWTVDFFSLIRRGLRDGGALLTYSTAKPVLAGLREAGFAVGLTKAEQGHRPATIATLDATNLPTPLPTNIIHALASTNAGVPYRDPTLTDTNRGILRQREKS